MKINDLRRARRIAFASAAVGAVALFGVAPVGAHNAGHLFLPNGTCQNIGSFRDAPLVGHDRNQLDLVPETPNPPFDEYGASFVGYHGKTPILPGPCR